MKKQFIITFESTPGDEETITMWSENHQENYTSTLYAFSSKDVESLISRGMHGKTFRPFKFTVSETKLSLI